MTGKIKWDVTDSDPDEAVKVGGNFASPKPGQYVGKILEVNPKGSGGDPDKPMIEVILELTEAEKADNEQFIGSRLWYYLLLPGHPSYAGFSVQKMDQFLLAAGVATSRKRKGEFNPDDLIEVPLGIIVRAGKNLDGDYRGEVGSVFAYDEESFGASVAADDEDLKGLDAADTSAEEDDDELPPYEEWSLSELRDELDARELDSRGAKGTLVTRLEEDDLAAEEEEALPAKGKGDFPFK